MLPRRIQRFQPSTCSRNMLKSMKKIISEILHFQLLSASNAVKSQPRSFRIQLILLSLSPPLNKRNQKRKQTQKKNNLEEEVEEEVEITMLTMEIEISTPTETVDMEEQFTMQESQTKTALLINCSLKRYSNPTRSSMSLSKLRLVKKKQQREKARLFSRNSSNSDPLVLESIPSSRLQSLISGKVLRISF